MLELSTNDQAFATVDTAAGSQLSEQELGDVLVLSLHALADVRDVGEDGLFVTLSKDLWRRDLVVPAAVTSKVGMLVSEQGEEASEQQGVGEVDSAGRVPDTGTGDEVTGVLGLDLLGNLVVVAVTRDDTGLSKLGVKRVSGSLLGGLLLLLLFRQGRRIEFAVCSGSIVAIGIGSRGLLLLLFLQVLKLLGQFVNLGVSVG